MKGKARPGAACWPGGSTAAPEYRKIENDPWNEWDQALIEAGYIPCRPCNEWHRPPECWITEEGIPALEVDE